MRTRLPWLISAVGILFTASSLQSAPVHEWSKRFGGIQEQLGTSVAMDAFGNAVVTGYFFGSVDFGGGPLTSLGNSDIFLAKFDATGNYLWSKRFGDASPQRDTAVAIDGLGNIILTGSILGAVDFGGGPLTDAGNSDIFVAKFDPNGNHVWSKRFGDANIQVVRSVAIDGSGSVAVTGQFTGSMDFGGGPLTSTGGNDIFLAKLNSNGNHIWSKRFGDPGQQEAFSVAMDGPGRVVVTGEFSSTVDFGGGPLTCLGSDDIFVAKFDASGGHLWSKSFGNLTRQEGLSVAVDGSGNAVVTGPFTGTLDFGGGPLTSAGDLDIFVVKFDPSGNHIWSKGFGDIAEDQGLSVAMDNLGNAVLTGFFSGTVNFGGGPLTSAGNFDIFVAMLNSNGDHLWSRSFGDLDAQAGASIAARAWGEIVLTGRFAGGVDFGGGVLTSGGGNDIFAARYYLPITSVPNLTSGATLDRNYPNPFSPSTMIQYTLKDPSSVTLGIYDSSGRLVARLNQGEQSAGTHQVEWDGNDESGTAVGSGVYFYRLEGAPGVARKKMVRIE